MIDAAIVGLGRWGRNLVDAVHGRSERIRFVRGVVRHPEAVADFARARGIALGADYRAVLDDPAIRAVVLATPHSAHVEQVVAAAAAGKAVFCEKPLALTRAGAAAAIDACRAAGVPLGLGHDKRFWPAMQALQRVVASGSLGTVLHLEGNFSNENTRNFAIGWRASPDESPGGSLTGTGVHVLDAFIRAAGPVKRAVAQHVPREPLPRPLDTVSMLLEFERGPTGVISDVRSTPLFWRVHVFGSEGSVEAVSDRELVLRRSGAPPERQTFEPVNSLRAELEAFADTIEGRAPYPITADEMLADASALEAIVRSLASGGWVNVSDR